MSTLLIVFVKNLEKGKVKTRLAREIGNERAMEVYKTLLDHTHKVCDAVPEIRKVVFYSDHIDAEDQWQEGFDKDIQSGSDLGKRMLNAFILGAHSGWQKIMIIGSDCIELSAAHLLQAESMLDSADVVYGPASDGGYYLMGMKKVHHQLFKNINWSTETVLKDSLKTCKDIGLKVELLETLNDVDEPADLENFYKIIGKTI